MSPVHIVTKKENVSELVLLPGDPLRAKYIAENFLENAVLINEVRNMLGYTGTYKGKKITVIGSGMGIPSVGIYSYELANFYNVKKIIRVGTAGTQNENIHLKDIVVATDSTSLSTFAQSFSGDNSQVQYADKELLNDIKEVTKNRENVYFGPIITTDTFDVFADIAATQAKLSFANPYASEMEAFGLFHIAKVTGIKAACIITIVDSKFKPDEKISPEDRQTSLNEMITIALEAIIK